MATRRGSEHEIGPETLDEVLAELEALEPEEEERAFRSLVARQPHLVEFVATVSEEFGELGEDLAMSLLFRVDALFTAAAGAPLPTLTEEAVRLGSERVVAELEAEILAGREPRVVQPHVAAYAAEYIAQPVEDEDGTEVQIDEEARAELGMAFRAVIEILDGCL